MTRARTEIKGQRLIEQQIDETSVEDSSDHATLLVL